MHSDKIKGTPLPQVMDNLGITEGKYHMVIDAWGSTVSLGQHGPGLP